MIITFALAVERNGVGYIIYVDKKDYAEATKVFESSYNTNVVVKQKEDMSKNQKIEYAMVKGGIDYSGVDQLLGLFNIFSSQTANPCQYNCPGISYVNLTGDLSGMEGALTNGATNAKFSIGLPDFISSVKEKGKEIKDNIAGGKEQVVTDSNGNTYKVKPDADDFKSEVSKSTGNGDSGNSLSFGSNTKSATKLANQMDQRGWTESAVRDTVNNPYTTRTTVNKGTGNSATVYYTKEGAYVVVDNIEKTVVQVGDKINPSTWIPDSNIVNPYKPK